MLDINPLVEYIERADPPSRTMFALMPVEWSVPDSMPEFYTPYAQKVEQGSGSTSFLEDFLIYNTITSFVVYKSPNMLSEVDTVQDFVCLYCHSGTLLLHRLESFLTNSSLAQASLEQLAALLVVLFITILGIQSWQYNLNLVKIWRQHSMMDARRHLLRILVHYVKLLLDTMRPSIPKSKLKRFFVLVDTDAIRTILEQCCNGVPDAKLSTLE